jgi:hypothetical protein
MRVFLSPAAAAGTMQLEPNSAKRVRGAQGLELDAWKLMPRTLA